MFSIPLRHLIQTQFSASPSFIASEQSLCNIDHKHLNINQALSGKHETNIGESILATALKKKIGYY